LGIEEKRPSEKETPPIKTLIEKGRTLEERRNLGLEGKKDTIRVRKLRKKFF